MPCRRRFRFLLLNARFYRDNNISNSGGEVVGHAMFIEAISKMPNSSISASGLNRNPQNINVYSCGYNPAPSLTSNYFSIFEIASKYFYLR